jgi:malate permease and related proteins
VNTLIAIFVNNILPVFLVVGTGALLGVTIRPDVKALSRTVFYVLTPCVIFSGLIRSQLTGAETQQVALFAALATLLTAGLAWLVATLFGWRGTRRRALTLPVLSVNAGNFGLSVVLFAYGQEAQARAMVYFAASAVIANSLGVALAAGGGSWRQMLLNVARVPMIYATIAALVLNAIGTIEIPAVLMKPIELLGGAAVPMLLLVLGLQLVNSYERLRLHLSTITVATVLRLLVAPVIAIGVAWLTGVQGITRRACMLEASMPAGVTSTILALEYDLEPEVVTGTVFVSTLFSALTLSIVIWAMP